ncbi:cysteine hydrolase family protein [Leifsonia sp. A12D58]|uniref:cysteine hydrolase family protein n=1 Tax=Leifsonia sp. A12D58 TaxID=3397674 RepID=UPI0039DF6400
MAITELDDNPALVVIDLQVGTLAGGLVHPVEGIVANANQLLSAFHARGLPVVVARVSGTPAGRTEYGAGSREFPPEFAELAPALDVRSDDIAVVRNTWSVFAATDLDARLRTLGVTQVVLAGVATSFGVESTARDAYDLGYNVIIATDAITDRSLDAHEASITRVFPALGQLSSASEIVARLVG